MENYKVILGDALTELKKIKDDSIDCIINDPHIRILVAGIKKINKLIDLAAS